MIEILENQIKNDKLSNAYIFESKNSSYNLDKALEFSKSVFNNFGINTKLEENSDFEIIEKDDKEKNISIKTIRLLIKDMYLRPSNGKIKIYIIKDSENLSIESSNALLKSIEEAKDYIILIFTTNNAYSLLKTIRSRCQIISFKSQIENEFVDREKLSYILSEIISGNFSFYYKNKDFFSKAKDYKEELFVEILNFFNNLIKLKYYKNNAKENKKVLFYLRKIENLPFDSIDRIIRKAEQITKGFKNNANFDMAVENFLIFIYREGRNIESSRDKL
ncbi:DNA polymerase III subunit delta' [Anaerococcus sp. HMSC075B03]|uniref:DNA polymerase III subunit delta' n=1 Tax=Anaerococcus TaxID=165779 RepID=UPI0008A45522|nr:MULTISPECIES: DNA polymerase III subunit delta' [Anaerococcus]MDU2648088.1 DNA polymerase III subunit delta' [Anaerococcus vaginalis]MDU5373206.1 DNA polymerase III subunit delta' [Anaerococcus vaginalis]MDU5560551.1 DNA polymerase III subunit delta' [Anaerococcus vaginalis]MDU7649763.1 DNA polymerase III subunit delta' [Anaerococcus vaginalis]OFO45047.1 DNA polymerase III subunit delta' [Anaerococcus sp. HMSC075B03]